MQTKIQHSTDSAKHPQRADMTNILLVEDDEGDVILTRMMLNQNPPKTSYNVVNVPRFSEALDSIKTITFDLVLLDLKLIDRDGVDMVGEMLAHNPRIPVIVYSGTDNANMRLEALTRGAVHFLVKGQESAQSLQCVIQQAIQTRMKAKQTTH